MAIGHSFLYIFTTTKNGGDLVKIDVQKSGVHSPVEFGIVFPINYNQLVVSTQLKNISQNGNLPQISGENKKYSPRQSFCDISSG